MESHVCDESISSTGNHSIDLSIPPSIGMPKSVVSSPLKLKAALSPLKLKTAFSPLKLKTALTTVMEEEHDEEYDSDATIVLSDNEDEAVIETDSKSSSVSRINAKQHTSLVQVSRTNIHSCTSIRFHSLQAIMFHIQLYYCSYFFCYSSSHKLKVQFFLL